jgi:hypothetical protein
MRLLIAASLFLGLPFVLDSASHIQDLVYNVDGSLAKGHMVARISQACTGPAGKFVSRTGKRVSITSGVLSIDLEPNDTCTQPANTTYSIKFTLQEGSWEETWLVTTSGSDLNRADVITDTTAGASTFVDLTHISGGTTKGDLIAHSGSAFARLGVGSNGSILFADSTEALGLNWGDLSWDKTNLIIRGGGTTASFPGWKRNGAGWDARLADNSDYTTVTSSGFFTIAGGRFDWGTRATLKSSADSIVHFFNEAESIAMTLDYTGLSATRIVTVPDVAGTMTLLGNSGIDAAALADGSVDNAEFQRLDGASADIQGQIDGKEGTLTNSAGLASALSDEVGDAGGFTRGTAGSTNECVKWDASGNLVTHGGACGSSAQHPEVAIGSLPAAAGVAGEIYVVNDAADKGDCTAASGSDLVACISDGTNWLPLAQALTAGGSGGLTYSCDSSECEVDIDTAVVPRLAAANTFSGLNTFDQYVVEPVNVEVIPVDFTIDTSTGDGKFYFVVPPKFNAWDLTGVSAQVVTVGTTGTLNVDLARCAVVASGDACSGTVDDMLSTNLTIDSGEGKSSTAATPAVIDTAKDDIATDQIIRVDIDVVHTTEAKGLILNLTIEKP